jgi:hypothetical protein
MFQVHINLNTRFMLITAEPNTLSHITKNSTSQHMGIKTAEITVRVNSHGRIHRKLSPKTVSAARTRLCFLSSTKWQSFEFTNELTIPVMNVTTLERWQSPLPQHDSTTKLLSFRQMYRPLPPVCCWYTSIVSPSSISKLMGVSVALIGCPSKRNLVVAIAMPWKEIVAKHFWYICFLG